MEGLLLYLITAITDQSEHVQLTDQSDTEVIRYSLTVADQDLARVIGRGGTTIKAITDIATVYNRKSNPDDRRRIYLSLTEKTS